MPSRKNRRFRFRSLQKSRPRTSVLDLPIELLFLIGNHLEWLGDLNSLVQTNQKLYHALNDLLYKRLIREKNMKYYVEPVMRSYFHVGLFRPVEKIITLACLSPEDGFSYAIVSACGEGQEDMAKALIDKGANVNVLTNEGEFALRAAVNRGHENIIRILFENGADMTKKWEPYEITVLHLAARCGQIDMIKLLLDLGMDIEVRDGWGRTPLQATLLRCGTHSNEDRCYFCPKRKKAGEPEPHFSIEAMRLLLDRKADIRAGDRIGSRPKDKARKHPDPAVRALFEKYDDSDSAEEKTEK